MTCFPRSRVLFAATFLVLATTAVDAGAQTCRGMPRGGGIAYARGLSFTGYTNGVALSKGVLGLGFNSLSETVGVSGWDANLRFTLPLGTSKFQICPGLGLEYKNDDMVLNDQDVKTRTATAAAGVSFGSEWDVAKGVSLIPFIGIDYNFNAIVFSVETDGEEELSGDTLSKVNINYGGLAKYKSFYVGFTADRYSDAKGVNPRRARWLFGLAFGGGSKSAKHSSIPNRSIRASGGR